MLWMLPAYQRFNLHDMASGQIDLRLVVEEKLIMLDGMAQIGSEHQAVRTVAIMLGSVEGVPAAGALSYMGSNYRPPHQRVHILVRLRVQGNTDIHTNIYGMPVNNERLFQGAQDSAGDSYACVLITATQ